MTRWGRSPARWPTRRPSGNAPAAHAPAKTAASPVDDGGGLFGTLSRRSPRRAVALDVPARRAPVGHHLVSLAPGHHQPAEPVPPRLAGHPQRPAEDRRCRRRERDALLHGRPALGTGHGRGDRLLLGSVGERLRRFVGHRHQPYRIDRWRLSPAGRSSRSTRTGHTCR